MKITKIVETCLYVRDLNAAREFYSELLGLKLITEDEGRHLFFRCGNGMLLLFNPDHTATKVTEVDGNLIPLHGTTGDTHIAFQAETGSLEEWKRYLSSNNVPIESEVDWSGGGSSLYVRDPSGNSVEVIFGNIWGL